MLRGGCLAEIQKRQTALKVCIGSLLGGRYVKQEGMLPNYVLLGDNTRVSRANIIGVVVSVGEDTSFQSVFIDDGSGKLSVRAFEQNASLDSLGIGDCVLIIGRPREFANQIYVLPEIIRKIVDKRWLEVRKLELERNRHPAEEVVSDNRESFDKASPLKATESVIEEEFVESSINNDIIRKIKDLDRGDGADFDEVINVVGLPDAEKIILSLMKNGDVFEVSPGKLKSLE